MNNKLINVIMFTSGAAVGVASTWQYFKNKYQQIATEEIASVKDVLTRKHEKEVVNMAKEFCDDVVQACDEVVNNGLKEKPNLVEYADKVRRMNYSGFSETKSDKKVILEEEITDRPFVIQPDEYGDISDYENITLTYYADKVLTDDNDDPVDDVDNVVGLDSLGRFGEFEADCVFVRNDRLKADYEICLDSRTYEDVSYRGPQRR